MCHFCQDRRGVTGSCRGCWQSPCSDICPFPNTVPTLTKWSSVFDAALKAKTRAIKNNVDRQASVRSVFGQKRPFSLFQVISLGQVPRVAIFGVETTLYLSAPPPMSPLFPEGAPSACRLQVRGAGALPRASGQGPALVRPLWCGSSISHGFRRSC